MEKKTEEKKTYHVHHSTNTQGNQSCYGLRYTIPHHLQTAKYQEAIHGWGGEVGWGGVGWRRVRLGGVDK